MALFLRSAALWMFSLLLCGCSAFPLDAKKEIFLIEFQELQQDGKHGIVAIAHSRLNYADIVRFEDSIRGMLYVDGLPRDLDACFYVAPNQYGLVRLRDRTSGSFVIDFEKYTDSGVSYRFELDPDGSVSGSGGFWSSTGRNVETKIIGKFKNTNDIRECTNRFPGKK